MECHDIPGCAARGCIGYIIDTYHLNFLKDMKMCHHT